MLSHMDMTELYWDKTIFYLPDYFAWGIGWVSSSRVHICGPQQHIYYE